MKTTNKIVSELSGVRVSAEHSLPLVVEPRSPGLDLIEWASEHRDVIRALMYHSGGLLFRGFIEGSADTFYRFMVAVSGDPLAYQERSSPRHEVGSRVYTSTDHPPEQSIYLHNEQSYNVTWPMMIFFHCVVPPRSGGGTPLADCRKIYNRLPVAVRERLEQRGYLYTRHFGTGFGLSWKEAFQTDQKVAVEEYCAAHDIEFAWGPDNTLTTRQVRPVSTKHPVTGEPTWFNHLTFFNLFTLSPKLANALLSLGKEHLPNHTYYGDGADIEPETLEALHAAYAAETVVIPWQEGDIMMLDNMLTAHGREAFTGPRRIVVGMTEPRTRTSGSLRIP